MSKIIVGSILRCSWGYDQTNVDFYVVTKRTPGMATVRRIGSRRVEGSEGFMSCRVLPVPDSICGTEIRRKVKQYNDKEYININSYASAYLNDDTKEAYCSWYA
jgi:hypothetical protein